MSKYLVEDTRKVTTRRFIEMKRKGEKIAMLTAYDYTTASILDNAGIDALLVGDSASNVMAGNILNDQSFYDKVCAQKYDLIAANIVADVLIWMAPVFKKVLKDDGYLLVSGIISERSDEVVDALKENGLCVKEFAESQEWAAVVLCHASL